MKIIYKTFETTTQFSLGAKQLPRNTLLQPATADVFPQVVLPE